MAAPIRAAQVRRGLAEWIAATVPDAEWSDAVPYGPGVRAVTLRDLPSQPDTAVAVEVYAITDDITLPDVEVRIQLTFRGPGDAADHFADDVFEALHGLHGFEMGGLRVQRARRLYVAPLGADSNGRERRSDNYALVFMRP